MTTGRFHERAVLVTGAARGIGLEIASCFLEEGACVLLADLQSSDPEKTATELAARFGEDRVAFTLLDVTHPDQANEAVQACVDRFGSLDVLVNNAGIVDRGAIRDGDLVAWKRVLDVNLYGTLHCSRAALNAMATSGGGVILNASSISARIPDIGLSAYCISKRAVETLTEVMAAEAAPLGIRVVAYAPGVTHTPMTDHLIRARGDAKLRHMALRRFGDVRDIANLVLFLASDQARFITGTTISIDGGTMIVEHPWKAWEPAQ